MKLVPAFGIVVVGLLSGCGGSGGGGHVQQAFAGRVAVHISWASNSGTFIAPASARSAVISSWNQDPIVPPINVTIDRLFSPATYNQTYQVATNASPGPFAHESVTFYSQPNGQGSIVGTAYAIGQLSTQGILLGTNGQPIPPVVTIGPVATLKVVDSGLTVSVGQTTYLNFTAADANGNEVQVGPSLGTWAEQPTPSASLAPNGTFVGLAPGIATVTVSYNGITSPPATFTVR